MVLLRTWSLNLESSTCNCKYNEAWWSAKAILFLWLIFQGFMYSNIASILFNDALNTFDLQLYGVRHIVKYHSTRDILYTPSHRQDSTYHRQDSTYHRQDSTYHRQDSTYHSLCYTSWGALAGMSSTDPPWGIDLTNHHTMSGCSTTKLHLAHTAH